MESIALIFYLKKVAGEGKERKIWMNGEEKGQKKKRKQQQQPKKKKKTHRTIVKGIRILNQARFQR